MPTLIPEIIQDTYRPEGNIFLSFIALSDSAANFRIAVLISEGLTSSLEKQMDDLVDENTDGYDSAEIIALLPYNLYLRVARSEKKEPKLTPKIVAKALDNADLFLEYPGLMEEIKMFAPPLETKIKEETDE